jgi:8-oxo-dGTP diphosphatase
LPEDQLFLVGQKAFIERDGRLLILFFDGRKVDLPGGRVQAGEELADALRREVREETGLEIEIGAPVRVWLSRRHAPAPSYIVGFLCRYLSGEVVLSDEHDSFRWITESDCAELDDGSSGFEAVKSYFALGHA